MAKGRVLILIHLAHTCLLWAAIEVTATEDAKDTFCVCFEARRSNWITGDEAAMCFGREFVAQGKNETCNPKIDPEECKAQRLKNLALVYVTDLKQFNKYFGISDTGVPGRGVMRNNFNKMVARYDRFFKYHPVVMEACGSHDVHKYQNLELLSNPRDVGHQHTPDRDLPDAVAMVESYSLADKFHAELDRVCDESPVSDFCVEMRQFSRIISKLGDLLKNANSFSPEIKEEAIKAYKLNFVPFILKYPRWTRIQPSDAGERTKLYEEFTEKLVTYSVNKDFKRLEIVMRFLPGYEDMRDCSTYQNGDYCLFKIGTDQLSQYLSKKRAKKAMKRKSEPRIYGVKSYIDYREYMKVFWKRALLEKLRSSKETSRIVRDFLVDEITESTGRKINELKEYFYKLEGYNKRIASADIAYLEGMMQRAGKGFYEEKTKVIKLSEELKDKIYEATITTFWWDLFGLGASLLTTGLDPRKWIQGNAISDLVETANELLATGANLRAIGALGQNLVKTIKKIKEIYSGILDNKHFLRNVRKIMPSSNPDITSEEFNHAKKVFLQQYTDYSPKVRRVEITQAGEMFNNIIDELCGMLDDARGPWAYVVAGQVHYNGNCYKLMSAVSTMTSYNEQLYEFQFEYMDALAEYMRTSTARSAAREINSKLFQRSSPPSLTLLRSMTVATFFTHEIQKWQIMEDYCDVLEYRNGGMRPAICKDLSTDFPTLVAYKPKECDSDVEQIVDIPAQENTSGKKPDSSAIYLNALLNGSAVTFQVPSRKWLIENKWITEVDVNSAIFVKDFQLFMPAYHRKNKHVKTVVTAAINKLYPEGPIYGIRPPAVFVSEYETGRADLGCRTPTTQNPYTTCKFRRMPRICQRSVADNGDNFESSASYPSIYASWSIQLSGYESYKVDNYATPLAIKAKVQLCKVRNRLPPMPTEEDSSSSGESSSSTEEEHEEDSEEDQAEGDSSQETWGCCYDQTYFKATANKCEDCPGGSKRALQGYACHFQSSRS